MPLLKVTYVFSHFWINVFSVGVTHSEVLEVYYTPGALEWT